MGGGEKKELSHRLEVLPDLGVESAALESDDLGGRVGVVGDGRSAVGAEESPDGLARAALALPLLDGAVDGQLVLRDDANEGCLSQSKKRRVSKQRTTLAAKEKLKRAWSRICQTMPACCDVVGCADWWRMKGGAGFNGFLFEACPGSFGGVITKRQQPPGLRVQQLTVCRARLALAVIAVVIAGDEGRIDVGGVGDGLAKAVSGENHFEG